MPRFSFYSLAALALFSVSSFQSATAAESYDNCTGFVDSLPATITTQGVWCLRRNLSTAQTSGNAIEIATNNVTIDCNRFKIGGMGAGPSTQATGIFALNRLNSTIENCNIRGFVLGVYLMGGRNIVQNNTLDGNIGLGVQVSGAGSLIRGNIILDTGNGPNQQTWTAGIHAFDGTDVIDNVIDGVSASNNNGEVYGIYSFSSQPANIIRNRIRNLATIDGPVYGIYNALPADVVIRENIIQLGFGAQGAGIKCQDNRAISLENVVLAFHTPIDGCTSVNDVAP